MTTHNNEGYTQEFKFSWMKDNATRTPDRYGDGKPTQYMKDRYARLVAQRGEEMRDIETMTYEEMYAEIGRLSNPPASDKQIDTIKRIAQRISFDFTDEELRGYSASQASDTIQYLMEYERTHQDIIPASDARVEYLMDMYLCEACDFTPYDIQPNVYLFNDDGSPKMIGDKQEFREKTATELGREIKAKFSNKEASDFIDKYRGEFAEWKATRATPEMVRQIRQFEEHLANLRPREKRQISLDQAVKEENQPQALDPAKQWYPPAYVSPFSDMDIFRMSREQANKYIDQLKRERADRELTARLIKSQDASDTLEFLRNNVDVKEKLRKSTGAFEVHAKSLEELNMVLYAMLKITGEDDQDLLDSAIGTFNADSDATKKAKDYIFSYVTHAYANGYIKDGHLNNWMKQSEVFKQIMDEKQAEITGKASKKTAKKTATA